MDTWMAVTALVIVLLPFVLMLAFQRSDVVDARGRRIDHRWRVRSKKSEP